MNRAVATSPRTIRSEPAPRGTAPPRPWYAQIGLLLASVLLLSLAFAPVNQFYLAWVGVAPWILVVADTRTKRAAFLWGFIGGWLFFLANMWWLWFVSPPGLFALTLYLSVFWGLAGLVIRPILKPRSNAPLDPRSAIVCVLLIPTIWVAFEWLRGNISFLGKQGLPWLYLGQTQSPILVMCQIADVTSVLGVTFWVVMVNALVVVGYLNRHQLRQTIPADVTVMVALIGIGIYGTFRLSQPTRTPGPSVLVVQSNYPQSNTGEKGAPLSDIVEFHVSTTRRALQELQSRGQRVDLVVWSETMMPPLNRSAREQLSGTREGTFFQQTHDAIAGLAAEFGSAFLVGGTFQDDWTGRDGFLVPDDRRNTAYFFNAAGQLSEDRYDKIHLVPFGEYIPFKHTIPPLYRLFIKLGPNYYEEYALTRGAALTVFPVRPTNAAEVRFVAPICFEDIVPSMVARMLHDGQTGGKRAELLVNITNDGWFRANQMAQHLQAAVFRGIENRVASARSVNTGISGFIDPTGRVGQTVPAGTEGWAAQTLIVDSRVAPYTRMGDAFPITCLAVTGAVCVAGWVANRRSKRRSKHGAAAEETK